MSPPEAPASTALVDPIGRSGPLDELDADYFAWLNRALPLVRAVARPDGVSLSVLGIPLIRLGPAQSRTRELFRPILGGWLAHPGGEMAFRDEGGRVVMAVRSYEPRLPRWVYRLTQMPAHRIVVSRFAAAREGSLPALVEPRSSSPS
jgi:hypothetical protein